MTSKRFVEIHDKINDRIEQYIKDINSGKKIETASRQLISEGFLTHGEYIEYLSGG